MCDDWYTVVVVHILIIKEAIARLKNLAMIASLILWGVLSITFLLVCVHNLFVLGTMQSSLYDKQKDIQKASK